MTLVAIFPSLFLARALKAPRSIAHSVCVWVRGRMGGLVHFYFSTSDWWNVSDIARRHQTLYGVARLRLMAPVGLWRNSTPFFGAAAFCFVRQR